MKKSFSILSILLLLTFSSQNLLLADDEPLIHSEAGIIIDAKTGQILYQKNPHKKLHPASITKLLTALIAIETLNPSDTMTYSKESINKLDNGSSRIGIKEGEVITVEDSLHGLLLMSANEVANALAEESSGSISEFVIDMNRKAAELGAVNSNFENPHGLNHPDHLTTVYDMALITQEIIKNDYFLEIMQHTMYQIQPTNLEDEVRYLSQQHKMLNNKNDMRIYREDVIAGKVGYTSESGHTLVTAAKQKDRTIIIVIMNTDFNNVYKDTEKLLDYGFDNFSQAILTPSDISQQLSINQDGKVIGDVTLSITSDIPILLSEGNTISSLTYNFEQTESLSQTSTKGDLGGQCIISLNQKNILTVPLYIDSITIQESTTETSEVEQVNNMEDTSVQLDKPVKKSFLPLLFILLIFGLLTLLCIPKDLLLNRK